MVVGVVVIAVSGFVNIVGVLLSPLVVAAAVVITAVVVRDDVVVALIFVVTVVVVDTIIVVAVFVIIVAVVVAVFFTLRFLLARTLQSRNTQGFVPPPSTLKRRSLSSRSFSAVDQLIGLVMFH